MNFFTDILNSPTPLTFQQCAELHDVVVRYPWFRTARIIESANTGVVDAVLQLRFLHSPLPGIVIKGAVLASGRSKQQGNVEEGESISSNNPICVPNSSGTMDVVERFLAASVGRIVAREDTPTEDMSSDSSEYDLDFVSEDLAEIYLQQGLKVKAKDIYTQLSLLYPEKSVYFAQIIDRIDQGD